MDDLDPGPAEIGEVVDRLRVVLAHEDDEGRPIDHAVLGERAPIRGDRVAVAQALGIALEGQDRDLRADALEDLVRDRLGSRERGVEVHVDAVIGLPLGGEGREDRALERLLHH